jgi:hypothetical protein
MRAYTGLRFHRHRIRQETRSMAKVLGTAVVERCVRGVQVAFIGPFRGR